LSGNIPWAMYSINIALSQDYTVQLYADTVCSLPLGPGVNTTASQVCLENKESGWGWFGSFALTSLVPLSLPSEPDDPDPPKSESPPSPVEAGPPSTSSSGLGKDDIIGIVLAILGAILVAFIVYFAYTSLRKSKGREAEYGSIAGEPSQVYPVAEPLSRGEQGGDNLSGPRSTTEVGGRLALGDDVLHPDPAETPKTDPAVENLVEL
jgi:hypothetical protein